MLLAKECVAPILKDAAQMRSQRDELIFFRDGLHVKSTSKALAPRPLLANSRNQFAEAAFLFKSYHQSGNWNSYLERISNRFQIPANSPL